MKTKLPYGLSILFFCLFSTLSFGQPFIPDPVDVSSSPTDICDGQSSRITMTFPQARVKYKLFGPQSSAVIDSILIPSNAPFNAYLSFSGANLNDGLNTLSITGFASGSGIYRVPNGTIVVDGFLDEPYWDLSNTVQYVTGSNALAQNSVTFGTAWDDSCLYIGMHVIDLTPNNPQPDPTDYNNDGLEFYIDPYSIKGNYTGSSPQQLAVKQIRIGSLSPPNNFNMWPTGRSPAGIQTATSTFANGTGIKINNAGDVSVITGPGYNVEFSIKWKNFFQVPLNTAPGAGFTFGFDLACNDDQTGAGRTEQSFWTYPADGNSWNESAGFGTITLLDGISLSGNNTLSGKSETLVATWDVSIKKTQPIFDYGSTAFCSNYTSVIPIHTVAGFSYAGNFSYPNGIDGDGSNTGNVVISDPALNGVIAISYLVDNPGCTTSLGGTGLLTVVGYPSKPVFNYGSGLFCNDVGNVAVNTFSGFIPGTFTTTASGLLFTLDANTGNISGTSPSADDVYSIVYTTDPLGPCPSVQGSANITLNQKPLDFTITVSSDVICSGGEVNIAAPLADSQTSYIWQRQDTAPGSLYITIPGTGVINADTISNTDKPEESSYYLVSAVKAGCTPTNSANLPLVSVTGPPTITQFTYHPTAFGADSLICNQGEIFPDLVPASPAAIYTSEFPLTVMDPTKNGKVTLKNALPGQFNVYVTIPGFNGCPDATSFFLFKITSSVGGQITSPIDNGNLCEGQVGAFTLNNAKGDKIVWQGLIPEQTSTFTTLETSMNTADFTSTFSGNNSWNVRAAVQNGDCNLAYSDNIIKFSSNLPSIGGVINSDQSITGICQDQLLTANVTGKRGTAEWFWSLKKDTTSFLNWHPAATNTSSVDSILVADALNEANKPYGKPIYYVAKVTNGNCDAAYSSLLTINFCDQSEYPPNALVPDAGNATSEWNLESLRLSDEARIKVFNRYGSVVYDASGKDAKAKWWNGGGVAAGTYWYFIEQGEGHPRKTGAVTIIK